jgi:nucleoside-diphosphate-sugar epimerase
MWLDAMAANDAGRVRATEVRALDFIGPGAVSYYSLTAQRSVLAGEPATFFPADLDAVHSWSYTVDTARTLVAAAGSDMSWGRAWHVPSTAEISVRELTRRLADAAGTAPVPLTAMSQAELDAAAATDSVLAEVIEMLYMTLHPAILDAADSRRHLGVEATPIDEVLADVVKTGGALTA